MNDHDLYVVELMEQQGGSFARSLADAMRKADPHNLFLIKQNFGHILSGYDMQVRQKGKCQCPLCHEYQKNVTQ